jgi:hypothetical protein
MSYWVIVSRVSADASAGSQGPDIADKSITAVVLMDLVFTITLLEFGFAARVTSHMFD